MTSCRVRSSAFSRHGKDNCGFAIDGPEGVSSCIGFAAKACAGLFVSLGCLFGIILVHAFFKWTLKKRQQQTSVLPTRVASLQQQRLQVELAYLNTMHSREEFWIGQDYRSPRFSHFCTRDDGEYMTNHHSNQSADTLPRYTSVLSHTPPPAYQPPRS